MPTEAQVYKQEPGAVTDAGHAIEPGYYWVRMRAAAEGLPPIPYGPSTGPFKTWRRAERDYQDTKEHEDKIAARNALHGKYGHLTPEELCERLNHCWKVTHRGQIRIRYTGKGHYYEDGTGHTWHRRRKDLEASLERFDDRFAREEAERPAREELARFEARRRALHLAAEDMLEALRATLRHVDDDMNNRKVTLWILREVVLKAIAKAEGREVVS